MIEITRAATLLLCAVSSVGVACGVEGEHLEVGLAVAGLDVPNGVHLNGTYLNGVHLNGVHLNGVHLNGVHLNGVHLNGVHLNGVHLNGAVLEGSLLRAPERPDDLLVGAILDGELTDGTVIQARIDAVTTSAADPELIIYQVSLSTPGDPWSPLCGLDDAGAPIGALAMAGRWDYRSGVSGGGAHIDDAMAITFACRGTAIAKCTESGYKPWKTFVRCYSGWCTRVSFAAHHQTCTRLIRADYCGDGVPHTTDGREVNLYDGLGVQTDTEAWRVEAEWNEAGARCLTDARRLPTEPISCLDRIYFPTAPCGAEAHFASDTLLMDEIP